MKLTVVITIVVVVAFVANLAMTNATPVLARRTSELEQLRKFDNDIKVEMNKHFNP
jgi:NADH:ubiquinone oxidoreductase subunit 3 (subunit A)